MKYLKTFEKISEVKEDHLSNEIIDDLKDICLELQDIGYTIRILMGGQFPETKEMLEIFKRGTREFYPINIKEVSEILYRIQEYMSDLGYNMQIFMQTCTYKIYFENRNLFGNYKQL